MVNKMNRKVSDVSRYIKQTSFCEYGPWYSEESNPLKVKHCA